MVPFVLVAFAALVAAPPPAETTVLALDLEAVSVPPDTARAITRLVVAALGEIDGLQVTSQEDMRRLANLEAAKQAMDCSDASCLADIADAMGARAVVTGSVTALGATTSITLSLFDSRGGRIVRRTVDASDLGGVRDALRPAMRELVVEAGLVAPPTPPDALFVGGVTALVAGGALLVVGTATTVICEALLQDAAKPGAEKESLQAAGQVGLGVGAGGLLAVVVGGALVALAEGP